jgi:hypothetical protein
MQQARPLIVPTAEICTMRFVRFGGVRKLRLARYASGFNHHSSPSKVTAVKQFLPHGCHQSAPSSLSEITVV